jgi:hypothetical protein
MPQSHMAALLPDHLISKPHQGSNQVIAGHTTPQFHAASTGINSSLT